MSCATSRWEDAGWNASSLPNSVERHTMTSPACASKPRSGCCNDPNWICWILRLDAALQSSRAFTWHSAKSPTPHPPHTGEHRSSVSDNEISPLFFSKPCYIAAPAPANWHSFDIAQRRLAEVPLVIPAEVRGVSVACSIASLRSVEALAEHQPPRFLKSQLFLELQRTHRGDGLEVAVEPGDAHIRQSISPKKQTNGDQTSWLAAFRQGSGGLVYRHGSD